MFILDIQRAVKIRWISNITKSRWTCILGIPFVAQTLISLTFGNFSNYCEGVWCILNSSFASPAHFSFQLLLVDVCCDASLQREDAAHREWWATVYSCSKRNTATFGMCGNWKLGNTRFLGAGADTDIRKQNVQSYRSTFTHFLQWSVKCDYQTRVTKNEGRICNSFTNNLIAKNGVSAMKLPLYVLTLST